MSQTKQWIDTLKRCLKARGLTYLDVAHALKLSEASVKRLFAKQSFSIQRLEQVCRMLDMSFSELARINDMDREERRTTLSLQQEKELASDPVLLSYFYLLLNGWESERIAERFELLPSHQVRLLARLDRLGLIELQVNNRVRMLTSRRIQWRKEGAVRQLYEREVKQAFLHDEFAGSGSHFAFESAELTPESARMVQRKLVRVQQDFDELAELDAKLPHTEKRGYGLMVALRPWAYWNIVLNNAKL